jgi:hypothetical protein
MTEQLKKIKGEYTADGKVQFTIPKEYIQKCGAFTLSELGVELEMPVDVFTVDEKKRRFKNEQ